MDQNLEPSGVQGCWAAGITLCSGKLSREHLISDTLLGSDVRVRGLPWCRDQIRTVGSANLTAKCLCEGHNHALSPCDQEAGRLRDAVAEMAHNRKTILPGSSHRVQISGPLFARWMAKTSCTMLASARQYVPVPLARYAFGKLDDRRIGVYFCASVGAEVVPNDDHVGVYWLHEVSNPDGVAVAFMFRGLPWLISTTPLETAIDEVRQLPGFDAVVPSSLVPRPRSLAVEFDSELQELPRQLICDFLWP